LLEFVGLLGFVEFVGLLGFVEFVGLLELLELLEFRVLDMNNSKVKARSKRGDS